MPRLRSTIAGRVIAPGDAGYDEARAVFYRQIDRRPAVIIRAANDADVSRVVSLARETGLELAVRSGGHSLAGYGVSDGGIVLDLRDMKAPEVDAQGRTAWVQTGATAEEYTNAAGAYGLATGFGDTGSVGLGGLTLGGGIGYLVRKHGLTIDSLLAADIVTADGELRRVDTETHPDLFWAIRGGGGNFGVATRFQFRLHEVGTVLGGMLILPATPHVLASLMAEAEAAPEGLSLIANIFRAVPMPSVPAEWHGRLIAMVMLVYAGALEDGERAVAPLRALGPVADLVRPMRYPEIYAPFEGDTGPAREVARSAFTDTFDLHAAEALVGHLEGSRAPMAVAQLRVFGGAMARVPAAATAFPHRQRKALVAVGALYERPEEDAMHAAWATGLVSALRQGEPGVYVNFLGDEGEARVHEAYPGPTWERLAAVKARYDPTNLFRLNQNVTPRQSKVTEGVGPQ